MCTAANAVVHIPLLSVKEKWSWEKDDKNQKFTRFFSTYTLSLCLHASYAA